MSKRRDKLDPVYVHARREAWIIVAVWIACLIWTVGYCFAFGTSAETTGGPEFATVLGMPPWVFWGVAVPWAVVTVFTVIFALFGMAADDLGEGEEKVSG